MSADEPYPTRDASRSPSPVDEKEKAAQVTQTSVDSAPISRRSSFSATYPASSSQFASTPATGAQTPDPLFAHLAAPDDALKKFPHTITRARDDSEDDSYGLPVARPSRGDADPTDGQHLSYRRPSLAPRDQDFADEAGSPPPPKRTQGRPPEISSFGAEIVLVMVCSAGLMLFSFLLGDVLAPQLQFREALGITNTELPWLVGSFNVANGLSVVVSGSLTDLMPPKSLMVGAFLWLSAWNIIGAFSVHPSRYVLFFVVRAMQGLAIGVLVSGSMSILGRVYKPGIRKNRVFSAMAACAPFGFSLGAIEGGLLYRHLPWIFGCNAIITAICAVGAYFSIPPLRPMADTAGGEVPSLRQFDFLGAAFAVGGCVCLLFGLTQGGVTDWSVYTCVLTAVGIVLLIGLFIVERYVTRPLIPTRLWKTKGFTPLMIAYFMGFGSFFGAWQFYAIQFWLRIQHASPIDVALYHLPNAIFGVIATWVVSRTLHLVPGHYIYTISMFAFTLGPAFFLPQTPTTTYWELSLPGVALVTFGPDLAFAAASIFITSNVARSYQGSAGSLLVTNQNLSSAIITSVADAIGTRVDKQADGSVGLHGLRSIWWFALGCQLVAALITVTSVRIPKEEEKEHVT
ncbi:efflux pump antibiotic resistance protein [Aspergillus ibericus CBS 121593]|uniref:Efflux pump antibiotic resistance protein n=1 Tax=Aspergillus ibericus CBS 121593 TaxID=1448316 RepID=A0A395GLI1_9EURO|nr:efflux pump antibiotic resistance protein [Aspergillus ibericus CBS 121593]RAK95838.1 efflux pump antibiotic resistance protein [Aspergillus ibericus CBS 121593]